MILHGVEEDEYMKTGNQKQLYAAITAADRVLNF